MIRVALAGAGRMGQSVLRLAADRDDVDIVSVWVREAGGSGLEAPGEILVSDDVDAVVAAADVLLDFTLPSATEVLLAKVVQHGKAFVCGVTGHDAEQTQKICDAAESIPILHDRNMSQGVAVLEQLASRSASVLGPEFSVAIREVHHVHKQDEPSGTALKLADAIVRSGRVESRGQIPIESERRGEIPGEHEIVFESGNERLVLSHAVTTRDVFAEGALRASTWLATRPAGLYTMQDVLSDQ